MSDDKEYIEAVWGNGLVFFRVVDDDYEELDEDGVNTDE